MRDDEILIGLTPEERRVLREAMDFVPSDVLTVHDQEILDAILERIRA